jgi:hypothetical protein
MPENAATIKDAADAVVDALAQHRRARADQIEALTWIASTDDAGRFGAGELATAREALDEIDAAMARISRAGS